MFMEDAKGIFEDERPAWTYMRIERVSRTRVFFERVGILLLSLRDVCVLWREKYYGKKAAQ